MLARTALAGCIIAPDSAARAGATLDALVAQEGPSPGRLLCRPSGKESPGGRQRGDTMTDSPSPAAAEMERRRAVELMSAAHKACPLVPVRVTRQGQPAEVFTPTVEELVVALDKKRPEGKPAAAGATSQTSNGAHAAAREALPIYE